MAPLSLRVSFAAACAGLLVLAQCAIACSSAQTTPDDAGSDARDAARAIDGMSDGGYGGGDAGDGGRPQLVKLSVSSTDAGSPVTLTPPFRPNVHDYYVRCSSGINELNVSMTASAGSESLLAAPTASAARASQALTVAVPENGAIVALATNGVVTAAYWVRCLPHDFPVLKWSLHPDAGTPSEGYYLVGNLQTPAGEAGYAMILNGNGVPVWYQAAPSGSGAFNVDSVTAGAISFIATPGPYSYEVHRLQTNLTTYLPPSDEHELQSPEGGTFLILRNPVVDGVDLTGLSTKLPDGGVETFGPNSSIVECEILQVDAKMTVLWQWTATDHLDPVKDCTFPEQLKSTRPDGGRVVDPFHCNSIDVDPANGNLLVSARDADSVFYVEKATGRILWKMGGSPYTKDGASYVRVSDPFHRQHDARLRGFVTTCSGATGQVTMFDDATATSSPGRGVLYNVTVGFPSDGGASDCGVAGPSSATLAWQYKGSVTSEFLGSFRIGTDGSRVIGWGYRTSDPTTFTEVDLAGNDLLDFTLDPDAGNDSYRAIKLPPSTFELQVLRHTAGR